MANSPEMNKRLVWIESSYLEPYPVQVIGESFYQDNLNEICGFIDEEEGCHEDALKATLFFEDENTNDPGNAVRVEIDGLQVGYLTKSAAKVYRKRLQVLGAPPDAIGVCTASIRGGYLKNDEVTSLGVRLDFDLNGFELETHTEQPAVKAQEIPLPPPPVPVAPPFPASKPKVIPTKVNMHWLRWMVGLFFLIPIFFLFTVLSESTAKVTVIILILFFSTFAVFCFFPAIHWVVFKFKK